MMPVWWGKEASAQQQEAASLTGEAPAEWPQLVETGRDVVLADLISRAPSYTPEWTSRSSGDAGVALVHLFSEQMEPVLQRLNQLPQNCFIQFLLSAGIQPLPATPAEALLQFTISDTATVAVPIPAGFQVGASSADGLVVFETNADLSAIPGVIKELFAFEQGVYRSIDLAQSPFLPFGAHPSPGAALFIGLPNSGVAFGPQISFGIQVQGLTGQPPPVSSGGVAPLPAPLAPLLQWDVLDGNTFREATVILDETGGLVQSGVVTLGLPQTWKPGILSGTGDTAPLQWVRLQIVYGSYQEAPALLSIAANVVRATAVQSFFDEVLTPVPGPKDAPAVMSLSQTPVLPGSVILEVDDTADIAFSPGTARAPTPPPASIWSEVDDLAEFGPDDKVYTLDPSTGNVAFGDGVHGMRLPPGFRNVVALKYQKGSGLNGAVDAGQITNIINSVPFISGVQNPLAATGGMDAETQSQALQRGPQELRARGRAVAPADYEILALRAVGAQVARAHAVPGFHPAFPGTLIPGVVCVFVIPLEVGVGPPVANEDTLRAVSTYLSSTLAPAGVEVVAAAPVFHAVRVQVSVVIDPSVSRTQAVQQVFMVLDQYLDPVSGGDDGQGWPFGGTLSNPAFVRQLLRIPGITAVPTLSFTVDGIRTPRCKDAAISANSLVWPGQHQVLALGPGRRAVSCAAGNPTFRLLDVNVGWSASSALNLTGLNDASGICLAQTVAGAVDPNEILQYLCPARLARGCGGCEWYLITPAPPQSFLLYRNACHSDWQPLWSGPCVPAPLEDPVAITTWNDRLAVSDKGANRVLIFAKAGVRLLAAIAAPTPGPLAFSPSGELLITSVGSPQIARYGLGAESRGFLRAPIPPLGTLRIIAVDSSDRVWLAGELDGSWTIWSAARDDAQFSEAAIGDLQGAFAASGLAAVSDEGFCFDQDTHKGLGVTTCFSWYGRPLDSGTVIALAPPQRQKQGQLLTIALDSGIPRCEWHRVRLDADIPTGTSLSMAVASSEDANAPGQGDPSRDAAWKTFPAGVPHYSDWTTSPAGSVDFLIDQPAGRYLYFRLRLIGNGTATPVVRRARIDFPRITSMDHIPAVYRETPKAEDFTKRFLALFDASVADIDDVIKRYPALLDPSGVPDQLLPWIGGFFNIGFDPTWNADLRRKILESAPQLYQQRGTVAGLQHAVELIFGVTPSIDELSSAGPWGSIAPDDRACQPAAASSSLGRPARVGAVRLFGKTRARFYLNRSVLGKAPLRSYGNPDQDPFASGAYRFRVLVPPLPDSSPEQVERLTNLIESQSPAHTVASIRIGGTGFLLGQWAAVGVDTAFVPLAAPVLGSSGNVRLNKMSILWSRAGRRVLGSAIGRSSIVGREIIAG